MKLTVRRWNPLPGYEAPRGLVWELQFRGTYAWGSSPVDVVRRWMRIRKAERHSLTP